ncbi:transporter family-2 protein [Methylobacterium sp. ap11]|uniref:DMT family transporter n=1 Tax=Methylobacterium sp. ap11 TaxID=1761799 RepID=UPI0008ACEBF6|nr:DMT family transporter [Methylobacterium sp. ap11]SEP22404.1 transporter family-2 protein [Methylobacterium sp. ap11]
MTGAAILCLVAGAGLVVQNALMGAMAARGAGLTGALLCNSLVGLSLLGLVEAWRSGPGFPLRLIERVEPWFVVPGLLGTLFVAACLYGYRQQGATVTVTMVVAGQLAAGIAADAAGLTGRRSGIEAPLGWQTWIGAALLVAGAVLVLRGRGTA